MHSKIISIGELLEKSGYISPFKQDALIFLKSKGITATEAAITLSEIYKMSDEDIRKFVYNSNIWSPESLEEIAYQTFLYLFGGEENDSKSSITVKLDFDK